ncbi:MAG: hypothetical protein ACE5E5_11470, partial [Phycisphaerae bacterium]
MKSMNDNAQPSRHLRPVSGLVDRATGVRTVFSHCLLRYGTATAIARWGLARSIGAVRLLAAVMLVAGFCSSAGAA